MADYKFRDTINDLETFLLCNLGPELLIPSSNSDEAIFFQNGDKMTINLITREMVWEPIKPGEMFNSKLSLRLHHWFGKGIITPIKIDQ